MFCFHNDKKSQVLKIISFKTCSTFNPDQTTKTSSNYTTPQGSVPLSQPPTEPVPDPFPCRHRLLVKHWLFSFWFTLFIQSNTTKQLGRGLLLALHAITLNLSPTIKKRTIKGCALTVSGDMSGVPLATPALNVVNILHDLSSAGKFR